MIASSWSGAEVERDLAVAAHDVHLLRAGVDIAHDDLVVFRLLAPIGVVLLEHDLGGHVELVDH